MNKTIYVADDEKNIRELISLFLTSEGFEVSLFSTGDELLKTFQKKPSDMVILDIMMEGTDGLSICTQIRKQSSALIIIVSARDSETDRIAGINLGSDDYLTKPFSPMELAARVKSLFRRMELNTGEKQKQELEFGNLSIDILNRTCYVKNSRLELTPTELALMVYMIRNSSRAISREELLKNVWKFDFDIDTRATDDLIKRLRKKLLQVGCNVKIESVWGFGFKLIEEESTF